MLTADSLRAALHGRYLVIEADPWPDTGFAARSIDRRWAAIVVGLGAIAFLRWQLNSAGDDITPDASLLLILPAVVVVTGLAIAAQFQWMPNLPMTNGEALAVVSALDLAGIEHAGDGLSSGLSADAGRWCSLIFTEEGIYLDHRSGQALLPRPWVRSINVCTTGRRSTLLEVDSENYGRRAFRCALRSLVSST